MAGSYDHLVVVLSVLIAVLASYAALDLAERVTAARGAIRLAWLISGATAMGIGIWSMHFTGMLAFRLPVKIGQTVRAVVEITGLNTPRKSATLRTRCLVKEDVVIDGEAVVLVPTRD